MSSFKKAMRKAYSLAESLLILVVIIIVANLTIPAFLNSYNDNLNYQKWQKELKAADQAIKLIQAQQEYLQFTDNVDLRDKMDEVMLFVQKDNWNIINKEIYNYYKSASVVESSSLTSPAGLMPDGSLWGFELEYPECDGKLNGLSEICGNIRIDVNGKKKPNMFGKDLFRMWILKADNGYIIQAVGNNSDDVQCSPNSTWWGTSDGCSSMALTTTPDKMP